MLCGRIGYVSACIALINIGDLDYFAGLDLDPLGKLGDLGSILLIGCRHAHREKTPQGVNRRMDFGVFAAFRPLVAAGAAAALHARLQRPAVEDCGRGRFLPAFGDSRRCAQVVGGRFKDLGFDPSLRLSVDDRPGRKVVGRH